MTVFEGGNDSEHDESVHRGVNFCLDIDIRYGFLLVFIISDISILCSIIGKGGIRYFLGKRLIIGVDR
jgi:hypothetical protein